MSIEIKILNELLKNKYSKSIRCRGIKIGFMALPDFRYYKYQSLANGCSSLQKKGFIKKSSIGEYFITTKGEIFLDSGKNMSFRKFITNKTEKDPKNLIVIYDIPQARTSERNWFRRQLQDFHFIMIQKSVWVGPAPLPNDFLEYVKETKIKDHFKTFKLAKGYE